MSAAVQGDVTLCPGHTRRIADRVCLVAWGLSILIFGGFIAFGIFAHDVASAAVIGTLVAALFIDTAVLASCWATGRARLVASATWSAMAITLLGGSLVLLAKWNGLLLV